MMPSDRAWCALAAGVIVYDVFARDGQTLSEGIPSAGRGLLATRLVIIGLAVHLSRVLSRRYDPLHWLLVVKVRVRHHG
jgi:hypothetical protein